mmetsp:Transcript_136488/g.340347  ORF Transcript_136488/g.340347 Transcript_136488/m.340347 type:complete len:251 (-) Transcript_136488:117-869(-)
MGLVLCRGGRRVVLCRELILSVHAWRGVQGPRSQAAVLELQLRTVQRGVLRGQINPLEQSWLGRHKPNSGMGFLDLVLVHRRCLPPADGRDLQAGLPRGLFGHEDEVPSRRGGWTKVWLGLGHECYQRRLGVRGSRCRQVRLPCAQPGALLQTFLQHPGCQPSCGGMDRGREPLLRRPEELRNFPAHRVLSFLHRAVMADLLRESSDRASVVCSSRTLAVRPRFQIRGSTAKCWHGTPIRSSAFWLRVVP